MTAGPPVNCLRVLCADGGTLALEDLREALCDLARAVEDTERRRLGRAPGDLSVPPPVEAAARRVAELSRAAGVLG